jgi:hypothetical protein
MLMRTLCLVLLAALLLAVPAAADYYRYRDDRGSLCFANSLDLIPPKYRARAELVVEAVKPPPAPAPAPNPYLVVQPPTDIQPVVAPVAPKVEEKPWQQPSVRIVAIVVGFLAVLAVVVMFIPSLMPQQLTRVIYIACFLGVFTLGFKLYSNYMVDTYFTIKGQVLKLFTRANDRAGAIDTQTGK